MLSQDRLSLTDASGKMLADVSGLNRLGVIEAVRADSVSGIVYRTVGDTAPILPASLQLSRGDVAIVDGSGSCASSIRVIRAKSSTPMTARPVVHAERVRWGIPAAWSRC